jgi:AraC family transcriptional activator of pobA
MNETGGNLLSYQEFEKSKFNVLSLSEFVKISNFDYDNSHKIECYAIILITSGHTKYTIDFKPIELKEGDMLLISPGQVFHCLTPRMVTGMLVCFDEDFFYTHHEQDFVINNYNLLIDIFQRNKLTIREESSSFMFSLVDLMKMETEIIRDNKPTSIYQQLISVLLHAIERECYDREMSDILLAEKHLASKFKLLVQKNISVKNNVEYFCNKLKISKSTLQKTTKLVYQKTPKDIIEEILLLEAKRMLTVTSLRIQEIGYKLGFADPTNFTKFFKRNVGITPDYFRKYKI